MMTIIMILLAVKYWYIIVPAVTALTTITYVIDVNTR